MVKFIHLRNHTEYSLCSGAIRIKNLIVTAKKESIPALAITDNHNMSGALEFSMDCCKAGIQPIVGCELVVDGGELLLNNRVINSKDKIEENFCKIVIIARTDKGFLNLLSLLSQSYLKRSGGIAPHIKLKDLAEKNEGIIVLSGGFGGILGKAILGEKLSKVDSIIKYFLDNFGDNFYMELQRHGWENEIKTEPHFLDIAYKNGIPLVATNDCYFLARSMFEAQDVLSCIAEGRYVHETNRSRLTPEHFFKSEDEMIGLFTDIPEAIENTVNIAKKITTMAHRRKSTLPHFNLPESVTEAEEMERISRLGLEERLKQKFIVDDIVGEEDQQRVRKQYFDQLEFEIDVIKQMDFPGYFLIVADFIVWSKTHDVPIGPGRGSGAGSVVAWSMKITDLDPIKFGLFFERFLNPERVSMPDFDIDFCQRGRERSIEYVQSKYGKDMVAQIITFGKLQSKAVVRDVGRVLGMGYNDVDKISKVIPFSASLEEALELDEDLRLKRQKDAEVGKLFDIAIQLEGLNRHSSVHAAGIVIGDKPLEQICPLYFDDSAVMPVAQYDKHYCEEVGLVKFDFLGLKTLTVIKDAVDFIKYLRNIDVDIENVRLDDKKTFELIKNADTLAVFQIESGGMLGMLKQIKPDNIEDIIALISLYRPGPMDSIPIYIRRKHGFESVQYMHPKMEPILKDTYGIIIYQEQVMNIAKTLAGYTLGGADILRRAMGKKIKEEMDEQRSVFVEGCRKHNDIDEKISNEIFDLLAKFAEYGFNKAHAASYAIISYQTAYLKAHYPVEFMTATLNMEIRDTDKINYYLQDIKKHKITVLPPNINKSDPFFRVELIDTRDKKDKSDEYYFNDRELAIRYGLGAIKGVGTDLTQSLKDERDSNGDFRNIFDFCKRVGARIVNKKTMESLAKSGSFDSIHENRKQINDSCEVLSLYAKSCDEEKNSVQISLFDDFDSGNKMLPKLVNTDDWIGYDRFQKEFEAFGFYLKNHPLDTIKEELASKGITFFDELETIPENNFTVKMAGVIITTSIKSNEKGRYAYVSLSDPTGLVEVTIFKGDLITEHKDWLDDKEHRQLVFDCNVKKDEAGTRVAANDFWLLDDYLRNTRKGVEKVKIFKKRTTADFVNFRKKTENKEESAVEKRRDTFVSGIKIYILNEKCLHDLNIIINNTKVEDKNRYTDVQMIIEDKIIQLPSGYFITEKEVEMLKNTIGIGEVEVKS
ncbi:MAG: DNA polymerase III subunit alpha [Rickettsiales bacterium]|jgi:DNA polymerase-3 subunit alpha|nr:DNA polymerase III subunit alpha [Rickettsiales bacterium]